MGILWEYLVVIILLTDEKYFTDTLNEYGRNGWEVISVIAEEGKYGLNRTWSKEQRREIYLKRILK